MPGTFTSALPFLIFSIIVAIIGMVVADLALILDLIKRQQEHKEGLLSVWYQRSKLRDSLKGIGLSSGLLFLVVAFGYSLAYHSPIWIWIFCIIAALIGVAGPTIVLTLDLRKKQQEHKEGLLSVWYRQPGILKQFGQIAFWLGLILLLGENAYEQAQGHQDTLIGFLVSLLFILLSVALYAYANTLQKRSRHSH